MTHCHHVAPSSAAVARALRCAVLVTVVATAGPLLAPHRAAATGSGAKVHQLTILARDFSFHVPSHIPAGWTEITIRNQGGEEHQAQVARINDGVTFTQLEQVASQNAPDALVPLVTAIGGPNAVEPGESATTIDRLTPGRYAIICFVYSADGTEHDAKGMLTPFTVTKAKGATRPPHTTATVVLRDFSFAIPPDFTGEGVVAVRNEGTQTHEWALYRLQPGKTIDDAKQFLFVPPGHPPPIPPPGTVAGGLVGLQPNTTGYVKLHLKSGAYLAVCFLGDAAKGGLPHALEGMIQPFTIRIP